MAKIDKNENFPIFLNKHPLEMLLQLLFSLLFVENTFFFRLYIAEFCTNIISNCPKCFLFAYVSVKGDRIQNLCGDQFSRILSIQEFSRDLFSRFLDRVQNGTILAIFINYHHFLREWGLQLFQNIFSTLSKYYPFQSHPLRVKLQVINCGRFFFVTPVIH